MRSPAHAAGVATMLGLCGLILPPVWLLSGAAIGLCTLRRGAAAGAQVVALGGALSAAVYYAGMRDVSPAFVMLLTMWGPAWLLSLVLRHTASQGALFAAIGTLVFAYVVAMHVFLGDLGAWWRTELVEGFKEFTERYPGRMPAGVDPERLAARLAPQMQNLIISASITGMTAMMLLSRWWQALLYNPGGFQREFMAARLPRPALYAVLCLTAVMFVSALTKKGYPALEELSLIAVLLFALQGIAVGHCLIKARRLAFAWLVAAYVLFLLIPHAAAGLGIVDGFMDLRRRHARPREPDND